MESVAGKRILFVITKSNWGGAQVYVYRLATKLKEAGADVAVALGGTGMPGSETGLLAAELEAAGVRVLHLPSIGRDISFAQEFRAFNELTELIRRERPDILHLNSSKAGGLGSLAGRRARVKHIVFTVHGWPHRESRNFFMRTFIAFSSWLTVVLCHRVIVLSRSDYRHAPVLFSRRKLGVITIGLDPFPLVDRDEARRFLAPIPELAKLPRWILMPAELTRNKGVDIAIHAFAGVSTRHKESALVITGTGELREQLERLVASFDLQKRIFFLGFVPEVRRFLKAGDIFLMPSRKEGFPYALLEAGVAELPALASAVGGIPEIITDGENGLLVRRGDVDAIADNLVRLLDNPAEAAGFGKKLHETVVSKFSEKEMVEKTIASYI